MKVKFLSPADDVYHVNKREFEVPFVCGAKDLGEALRRINEGASMIRTKRGTRNRRYRTGSAPYEKDEQPDRTVSQHEGR